MPYPYKNDLGKNPPPGSSAAGNKVQQYYQTSMPDYDFQKKLYSKVQGEFEEHIKAHAKALNEVSAELKAEQQQKMMDQLFGANPGTIKFPNVAPAVVPKDYGNHPASKYGKADHSAIPDAGPAIPIPTSEKEKAQLVQELLKSGILTKEQVYAQLWGAAKPQTVTYNIHPGPPKPIQPYYGFTKPTPNQSFEIDMAFKIKGLAGLDDQTLYAKQEVATEFIHANIYGKKNAAEQIVDDMLRQIKLQIMEQIKKAK